MLENAAQACSGATWALENNAQVDSAIWAFKNIAPACTLMYGASWAFENVAQTCAAWSHLGARQHIAPAQELFGSLKTLYLYMPCYVYEAIRAFENIAQAGCSGFIWALKNLHWPVQEPLGRSKTQKQCTREHLKELFKKTVSASSIQKMF